MAESSLIEWTDATWNPIAGCSVVSPGCTNCYAMGMARRHELMSAALGRVSPYAGLTRVVNGKAVWTGELRLAEDALTLPLRWRKPRRIFVNSMSDLFHDAVPDAWIDRVFAVIALAPQHSFQVLTKRAARMRAYLCDPKASGRVWSEVDRLCDRWSEGALGARLLCRDGDPKLSALGAHGAVWGGEEPWPLRNTWLGVSAEDQRRADERVPELLATPAAVRFVSAEPLLGPLDIGAVVRRCLFEGTLYPDGKTHPLGWVIVGGESGPGARPMHPDWARSLRDQCAAAGVPYHFKQWGSWAPGARPHGQGEPRTDLQRACDDALMRVGKKAAGRLLDGVEHNGMPEVARA